VLCECRYETNLLNTAGQAMDFLSDVNHDNACVHLDTYHMHIEESGFETAVRLCGSKLGYVHLGESHR
jgi:D-psicose/D-tagatose/L-ribulose 3-epimerase